MTISTMRGLEKAKWIYENYDVRVKELQKQGNKIVGYFCHFAPLEIVEAAGLVPYALRGNMEDNVTHSDSYVEPYLCPMVRKCFDQRLKGKDEFLDGLLISHSCDSVQRIYGIWTYYLKPSYSYLFNVPHVPSPWSVEFFKREIIFFKESLEKFIDKEISIENIEKSIEIYNKNRNLIKELYTMMSKDQLLSYSELFYLLVAGRALPANEHNIMLNEAKDDVLGKQGSLKKKKPRVMIYGSVIDHVDLINLIESCGCDIVVDDNCLGTRTNFRTVPPGDDYLEGFAKYYFTEFKCPRTFFGTGTERFEYITDLANDYKVDGVIMYVLSFCDPYQLDIPDLRDYLKGMGIPSLVLEDDYSLSNIQSLKTRVEAFIETLAWT